jgi:hypothetical protein
MNAVQQHDSAGPGLAAHEPAVQEASRPGRDRDGLDAEIGRRRSDRPAKGHGQKHARSDKQQREKKEQEKC